MDELPLAGWFQDPWSVAELRYWDGTRWTPYIADRPDPGRRFDRWHRAVLGAWIFGACVFSFGYLYPFVMGVGSRATGFVIVCAGLLILAVALVLSAWLIGGGRQKPPLTMILIVLCGLSVAQAAALVMMWRLNPSIAGGS